MSPILPFIDLAAQQALIKPRLDAAIARVLAHGQYVMGPEVAELEARLCAFTGARHCVTCANGTDALALALMALEAGPGDAVLVPSFTFAATAEVVPWTGAVPVFADVREDGFNLDPAGLQAGLEAAVRQGLRPVGIVAVDLFGQPADYGAIHAFAEAAGLWVLADAAQSLGGSQGGRKVGTLARVTTTSFFPAKPLGCYGDGGAVFTEDAELATLMRSLRAHGQGTDTYDNVRIGMNARLDTLQAAILLAKLEVFEQEIGQRQRVAAVYAELLGRTVAVPEVGAGNVSAWAQYTIRTAGRDALAERLRRAGVPTAIHYRKPLHRQPAFAGYPVADGGCPVSDRLSREVLSLPMHPYLDRGTQERIAAVVAG